MRDYVAERFEALFGPEFGHGKPFDLNLLRGALSKLGNPQTKVPPVFHVAGTNGKGSTIAFTRAIAEAGGHTVHAFTKPHLFALNERFVVAGRIASDDALIGAAERVAAVSTELTQFDAQVAAALLLFSETPADVVLLEAGMGGRDDSTNIIDHPALTIITPIALDHQDALGPTLAEIAEHKAGILKPRVLAIIARQDREAMDVIEAKAAEIGARLWRFGGEWDAFATNGRLIVKTMAGAEDLPLPVLLGPHQIENAGLAVLAGGSPPISEHDDIAAKGLANARLAGRLQPLTRGALSAPIRSAGGEVWVDAGHNAHAAQALARSLGDMQRRRKAATIAIIGMRARKDADAFIGALAGAVDHVIGVPLAEAHVAPAMISAICNAFDVASSQAPSLEAAMQNAAQFPAPRVLICGSFLLAAEALELEARV